MALREATYDEVVAALRDAMGPRIVPGEADVSAVCARFPAVPRLAAEGIAARLSQTVARRRIWRFEGHKRWSPAQLLAEFERRWRARGRAEVLAEMADELGQACAGGHLPPCYLARVVLKAFLAARQAAAAAVVRPDFDADTECDSVSYSARCPGVDLAGRGVARGRESTSAVPEAGDGGLKLPPASCWGAVRRSGEACASSADAGGSDTPRAEEAAEAPKTAADAGQAGDDDAAGAPSSDEAGSAETPKSPAPGSGAQPRGREAPSSFARLYRRPSLIPHAGLAAAVAHCHASDALYSPAMDALRTAVGREWEDALLGHLRRLEIPHMAEAEMRTLGYARTPDAVLREPIAVRVPLCGAAGAVVVGAPAGGAAAGLPSHNRLQLAGTADFGGAPGAPQETTVVVKWIESKAWFGDPPSHASYLRDQYWPYYNRFGPGLVLYWFGFVAEPSGVGLHEGRGIAVLDAFPADDRVVRIVCPLYTDVSVALACAPADCRAAARSCGEEAAPPDALDLRAVCDALLASAAPSEDAFLPHAALRTQRRGGGRRRRPSTDDARH